MGSERDKVLSRHDIGSRLFGPRYWVDEFCDAVKKNRRVDREVLEGLSEALQIVCRDVDALPENGKNRSVKIGQTAATHLGFLAPTGRPKNPALEEQAKRAALHFYELRYVAELSYTKAIGETAEKFNKDERQIKQYCRQHARNAQNQYKIRKIAQYFRNLYNETFDALFSLTNQAKRGGLVAKSGETEFVWDDDIRLIIRPPTEDQTRTIRRWQNPRDRARVMDWWFSNTVYLRETDKTPIGEEVKISQWAAERGDRFLCDLLKFYGH